ncbi:MAG: DUF177 domain-containing protein [Syntrophales bacterium]
MIFHKIKIWNIPDDGYRFQFSRDGRWLAAMLPEKRKAEFELRRVDVCGVAAKIGETVTLDMEMNASFYLECCRCLAGIEYTSRAGLRYTLAPFKEGADEDEAALSGDDLNFGYYRGDEIELDPIVLEQVILQVPIKPLCKEGCKGLCSICGADLNMTVCGCRRQTGHAAFAVLKNFVVHK